MVSILLAGLPNYRKRVIQQKTTSDVRLSLLLFGVGADGRSHETMGCARHHKDLATYSRHPLAQLIQTLQALLTRTRYLRAGRDPPVIG